MSTMAACAKAQALQMKLNDPGYSDAERRSMHSQLETLMVACEAAQKAQQEKEEKEARGRDEYEEKKWQKQQEKEKHEALNAQKLEALMQSEDEKKRRALAEEAARREKMEARAAEERRRREQELADKEARERERIEREGQWREASELEMRQRAQETRQTRYGRLPSMDAPNMQQRSGAGADFYNQQAEMHREKNRQIMADRRGEGDMAAMAEMLAASGRRRPKPGWMPKFRGGY